MSGLLLCVGKRGKIPFYNTELKIGFSSLEELCYYLYHNIFMIHTDFFSDELIDYIQNDMELDFLADQLETLKEREAPLEEYVMAVLQSANYYRQDELKRFREKVREYGHLTDEERIKFLGDSYIQERLYMKAMQQYEKLIALRTESNMDKNFWAKVYHNLGVAAIRMFYFDEAAGYFKEANTLCPKEEFAKKILLCYYMAGDREKYENAAQNIESEKKSFWEQEWEEWITRSEDTPVYQNLQTILKGYRAGNMEQYREDMSALIELWKQEYREEMS